MTRVAAIQAAPVSFDLHKSVDKLQRLVAEAKQNGAELVILPEAFLSAYPRNIPEFGIGYRKPENREWYSRYVEAGILLSRLTPVCGQSPPRRCWTGMALHSSSASAF